MNRAALLPLLLASALTGCGGSNAVNTVANSPVVKKDTKRATARAQKCLADAELTTTAGRKDVLRCVGVSQSHERAALRCLQRKLVIDITHTERLATDISDCALG